MFKWIVRLLIPAALVALVLVSRATLFAPQPVAVRVVAAETGLVEATITNSRAGSLRARRRAQLSPETSGRVVSLSYREGDHVDANDVIVRMDDASQRSRLVLAKRTLAAAEARHAETCVGARQAKREHDRYKELEDGLISPHRLDQLASVLEASEAACGSSSALVEQTRSEILLVEAELEKTVMCAPFSGILAEVSVEIGEFITPSPPGIPLPSVIDLIDPGSVFVSAPMDEVDSAIIHAGQEVRITLDPYPGRSFDGRVSRVAPYVLDVESQNRTVEIEIELADRAFAQGLLPGTTADVEVILEVHEDVLRIPTSTLMEGGRVLVLENGVLVERILEIGLKNWNWTEVLGGLQADEMVVSSLGNSQVKAGVPAELEVAVPGP